MEDPDLEDLGREVRYRSAGREPPNVPGQEAGTQGRGQRSAGKPPQRTEGSLAVNSHLQRQGFQSSQRFLDRATRAVKIEDSTALRDLFLQAQNDAEI